MIRSLLATTALVAIAASGANAAEEQASERYLSSSDDAAMASNIIGEMVYSSTADDAESIGEVNDLLVGDDGNIDAAIIGVGGFLGLGEKSVAVRYDQLNLTTDDDGTYYVVLETSKEELEAAPEFDVSAVTEAQDDAMSPEGTASDQTAATDQGAMAPRTDGEMAGEEDTAAADQQRAEADQETAAADQESMASDEPAMDRESAAGRQDYEIVDVSTMGADELIGTNVYSYNDENVGDIGDIVLTDDGQIDAVVIDVGGFLGIGEKPVAVAFEDLEVRADENGTLYVYTQFTEEQLEGAPEYNAEEYEQGRDQMRVRSSG